MNTTTKFRRTFFVNRKQSALDSYLEQLSPVPDIEIDSGLASLLDSLVLVDEPAPGVLRATNMQREGRP